MPKLKSKRWNGVISAVFAIAVAILILTFSIGLPIYFRPFYYMQIDSLEIKETVIKYNDHFDLGYADEQITNESIKDSYDEVLDYLTLGKEFGTGIFKYSDSGKSHFADCKILFDLNAIALLISLAIFIAVIILEKKNIIRLSKPFGFNIFFVACVGMLILFAVIGIAAAAVGFEAAFTVFHKILFPGKTNWYFDPFTDGIILALPAEFFLGCAILILSSIILITATVIVYGIIDRRKALNSRVPDEAESETEKTENCEIDTSNCEDNDNFEDTDNSNAENINITDTENV